jgi:hypothetical protein
LLYPKPILKAVAQFDEGLWALIASGFGVVEQSSFWFLGHSMSSFIHDAEEVIRVGIVLLLSNYLPAVGVNLIEVID